ncbi:MAG: efflux RND transporter permease subunit [Gammaproteobacteria bacterium]|nr:efflux RND transporter permease subunit [Gammaproteobacteria bacterium]
MSISAVFIARPVATTLLTLAVALGGILSFTLLPVAPLPQVDFPTIAVQAALPGASPDTIATTLAAPLERTLGQIAGVTEMTSSSSLGTTNIILQFELNRDIDGAARDVQGAINAARALLPSGLPTNPTYRKVNPADSPILILALTSDVMTQGQLYDTASTVLAQRLSQVPGVGQVTIGGSALPAVRVAVQPPLLSRYAIGMETVRTAITAANVNQPKGVIEDGRRRWQIEANDQANTAAAYRPLIIAYRNGAPIRLADVADVTDSVQDVRNAGFANGKPAVLLVLNRQPGANIIDTVDHVKALLPPLRSAIPGALELSVVMDRTPGILASLHDVEFALAISTALVVMTVFLFLRNGRATLIPAVAVPVSLLGTFGAMYFAGFSLNTMSLMALTIATGFVVDDAVVVLENVSRHLDAGMSPEAAARQGVREVSFTVVSMSLSLIAVFVPILFMGGLVGRLFREFAVTLSAAIVVSLLVSLTTTPMMCAKLLKPHRDISTNALTRGAERAFNACVAAYQRSLDWALRHRLSVLLILLATVAFNVYLYVTVPKGFFPLQDTGKIMGGIQADQDISFQDLRTKLIAILDVIKRDPAVDVAVGSVGGQRGGGFVFVSLKPLTERKVSSHVVIARLRPRLAHIAGAILFMQPVQDLRAGGRASNAQYQYTLRGATSDELRIWSPRVLAALRRLPKLVDVNTDQQDKGVETMLTVDRDAVARLGLTQRLIDTTLNDLFGQRLISTIYTPLNQYRVVLEAAPDYLRSPEALNRIYIVSPAGASVPFSAFSRIESRNTALSVNHQGQFAATTISFNLPPSVPLSVATQDIEAAMKKLGGPSTLTGEFQGTAKVFQEALANQVLLIVGALAAVYIVLGILYESYIHPLTILSTLPSAGVGALLALQARHLDFSLLALIGVLLLVGIVKKNAIMMIDFAQQLRRESLVSAEDAIFQACLMRFRPIVMTTFAALFGAVPLAVAAGQGAELRQPLGIAIVGGLALSQLLTLYTTPVVYLYLDRVAQGWRRPRSGRGVASNAGFAG